MIQKYMSIIRAAAYRKNVCKFTKNELNKLDKTVQKKLRDNTC